jgi:hypothetical protein
MAMVERRWEKARNWGGVGAEERRRPRGVNREAAAREQMAPNFPAIKIFRLADAGLWSVSDAMPSPFYGAVASFCAASKPPASVFYPL